MKSYRVRCYMKLFGAPGSCPCIQGAHTFSLLEPRVKMNLTFASSCYILLWLRPLVAIRRTIQQIQDPLYHLAPNKQNCSADKGCNRYILSSLFWKTKLNFLSVLHTSIQCYLFIYLFFLMWNIYFLQNVFHVIQQCTTAELIRIFTVLSWSSFLLNMFNRISTWFKVFVCYIMKICDI